MNTLKVKDNSQLKEEDISAISSIIAKVSNKTLGQLEKEGVFIFPEVVKDSNDITDDQMILQEVNQLYPRNKDVPSPLRLLMKR